MKTFKQLIAEVAQPNNDDELNFKEKHTIEVIDNDKPFPTVKRSPRRRADYDEGEDEVVYEASKLDPVGKADADIDNDGDTDNSDEFLHARRKAIAKAMKKEALDLREKAVSQAQQQAAGVALAVKRGDKPKSALIGASKEMYKMSEKDLEDFAKTKHKGLPEKITEASDSKIIASINAGDSIDVTVQKNLNRKGDNKDEILKVIRDYNWKKRMKKEEVGQIDEAVAGPQDCWPGYRKVGTKMGTGRNTGNRVNDCEKLDEDATLDQIRAILTKKNDGTKVVKDKSGYFHIKTANSHKGPFHTMKDVLKDLSESTKNLGEALPAHLVRGDSYVGIPDGIVAQAKERVRRLKPATSSEHYEQMHKALSDLGWEMTVGGKYVREGAFVAKAASAYVAGKKKFKLDDEEFPVTIKPSTAKKIVKENATLTETFKVGAVKLNDGSSIIIKEQDAKILNQLVKELSGPNREAMMTAAMKDKTGFNEILGFAKEAL